MSKIQPYSPLHKPKKDVSFQRMQQILFERSGRMIETPEAGQSPQAKPLRTLAAPRPVPLRWERPTPGATALKTTCQRYCCSKVSVMGQITYELWRFIPAAICFRQVAVGLASFAEAQKSAQADWERT